MYRKASSVSAFAVIVLGMSGGLAAFGGQGKPTASKPTSSKATYDIAMVAGVTGADSSNAIGAVAGARAAMNYLNRAGGVDGHKIKIAVFNDQSSPTVSPAVAQQAVSSHPVAVLDSTASTEFTAREPVSHPWVIDIAGRIGGHRNLRRVITTRSQPPIRRLKRT
jgi:branched-chain amino acid transport system substrate-binding protein